MRKLENIKFIKAVVRDFGTFTVADVQADSSPIVNSIGGTMYQLAEHFNQHRVEVVDYVHETEVNSEQVSYEDLPEHVIEEIVVLAQTWAEMNLSSIL